MKAFLLALLFAFFSEGNSKCITITCVSNGGVKKCSDSELQQNAEIYSITPKNAEIPKQKYPPYWCYDPTEEPVLKPTQVVCEYRYFPAKPCQEGYHFGYREDQMWVDLKCGGTFTVCYHPDSVMYCTYKTFSAPANQKITYEIDLNNNIVVMAVSSKRNGICIKNQPYGRDGKNIWISNGCEALFYLCVNNNLPNSPGVRGV